MIYHIVYYILSLLLFNRFAHSAGPGREPQRVAAVGGAVDGPTHRWKGHVRSGSWQMSSRERRRQESDERREKREERRPRRDQPRPPEVLQGGRQRGTNSFLHRTAVGMDFWVFSCRGRGRREREQRREKTEERCAEAARGPERTAPEGDQSFFTPYRHGQGLVGVCMSGRRAEGVQQQGEEE